MSSQPNSESAARVAELAIAIPARSRHDIGTVIAALGSADLIPGVEIEPMRLWPDDRGFFSELFRFSAPGVARDFRDAVQVSTALAYPGAVKAAHYHARQTDLWAPVRGMFQVALFDLRRDLPSFGSVNTFYVGEWRPWLLRIPPGVGHGYKCLGPDPGLLVYATDRFYDPSDEGRIAYNDPGLNYDWECQHK